MARLPLWLLVLASAPAIACGPPQTEPKEAPKPVRVTVVVVLASEEDETTNPKLATLAKEVRKRNDEFVGFRIAATLDKSIAIGKSHTFELPEKQEARVTVAQGLDQDGRIEITVRLPGLDDVTYSCICGKFFPIVTPYKLESGETVLVAILAKPCTGK